MALTLPLAGLPDIRPDNIVGPRDIRAVRTLRISVTDRCNFRCVYCMPAEKIDWVARDDLLTFEEIRTIAQAAIGHGITAFKITGGEPTVRHELPRLVAMLRALPGVTELSMTTNGALLDEHAASLKQAGLDRITVSLDSLCRDKFRRITRGADLDQVWRGIRAAVAAGFGHPKINCVVMRGVNDDEPADFAALTLDTHLTVRFIEYMPLGRTALGGEYEQRFINEQEISEIISRRFGALVPAAKDSGAGPATTWRIPRAAGRIGFISAMSKPFCATCNRLRLTAEGQLRSCLFDGGEVELRPILRGTVARGQGLGVRSQGLVASESAPFSLTTDHLLLSTIHDAFINCVAFKPEVHSYFGNRQMSQIGG